MKIKFYRYDAEYTGSVDEDGLISSSFPTLRLTEFNLIKETLKSYKVVEDWDAHSQYPKIFRKKARKKFACLTKEEAAKSFLMRKQRQVKILSGQLNRARMELNLAEDLMEKPTF
jgi:hypothetical protein